MRRIVGWLVSVAALTGLGTIIHNGAGPTARWNARVEGWSSGLRLRLVQDDTRVIAFPNIDDDGFVISGLAGPVRVYDAETGRMTATAWEDRPRAVAYGLSPGGRWAFALTEAEGAVRLYDTAAGQERTLAVRDSSFVGVFFSPDDRLLFLRRGGAKDGPSPIHVFEPATGTQRAVLQDAVGKYHQFVGPYFCYQTQRGVVLWDGQQQRTARLLNDHEIIPRSENQSWLVTRERNKWEVWWLYPGDHRLITSPVGDTQGVPVCLRDADGRVDWEYPVTITRGGGYAVLSPNGRFVALMDAARGLLPAEGDLHLLDTRERRLVLRCPYAGEAVFSPDSRRLLVVAPGHLSVDVIDAATGAKESTITVPPGDLFGPFEASAWTPRLWRGLRWEAGGKQVWVGTRQAGGRAPPTGSRGRSRGCARPRRRRGERSSGGGALPAFCSCGSHTRG